MRFAIALMVLATGCGPSVPAQIVYRLTLADGAGLQGSAVTMGGAPAGTVSATGAIELTTPSTTRPSGLRLALSAPTQCGARTFPIVLTLDARSDTDESIAEQMASPSRFVGLRGRADTGSSGSAIVIVDRSPGDVRPVRIGEGTLPTGSMRTTLFVGDCSTTAPVRVGDETIGTWRASSGVTLVSAEPTCHRLSTFGYGDAVTGPPVLFGQRVRVLERIPDYLLTPAPATLRSRAGAEYVRELVRAECPTGRPFAEVGAELANNHRCGEAIVPLRRAVQFDQDDIASATLFVRCASTDRDAHELVRDAVALHPEAADALNAALRDRALAAR